MSSVQKRKELRESMRIEEEQIWQEYLQLERTLRNRSDIQTATDNYVKKATEVRVKWNKLIRARPKVEEKN